MIHDNLAARVSTRLAFLVAGFGISCWAPLVPYAKERLAVLEVVMAFDVATEELAASRRLAVDSNYRTWNLSD